MKTITLKNCKVKEKEDCFIISIPDHRELKNVGNERVDIEFKLIKDEIED